MSYLTSLDRLYDGTHNRRRERAKRNIHSRVLPWNAKVVDVGQHGRYEAGRKSVGKWDLRGIHRREMEPGGGRETTCRE
jgi:hypothetical protein